MVRQVISGMKSLLGTVTAHYRRGENLWLWEVWHHVQSQGSNPHLCGFIACVFKHFNLLLPNPGALGKVRARSLGSSSRWRLMLNWAGR